MKNKLINFLNQSANKNILWVGMGNPIRNDDGVGVYISERIKDRGENTKTLTVELGLENHIGKINSIHPEILVLIDCTSFGQPAGYCDIIPLHKIRDHTINTHHISLQDLARFVNTKIFILGIQPENIDFGQSLSPEVLKSADQIIHLINGVSQ
jgi:hydrogenase 3 maturation protease